MRKINIFIIAMALMLVMPVSAATVLLYNCDKSITGPGVAGQPIQPGPGAAEGIADLSGNGYNMWGWCNAAGDDNNSPLFSADTITELGFSLQCTGGLDGYTTNATINNWSPTRWTVEVSVKLNNLNNWYTFIGRDNNASETDVAANFYLQKMDDAAATGGADQIRINVYTTGGSRYIVDAGFTMVANQWYGIAAGSDGTTLYLYVDKKDGNGYQLMSSTAMSATEADNALNTSGGGWSFGRGWYNGGAADGIAGYIDNIKFSDDLLDISEMGIFPSDLAAHDQSVTPLNTDGSVGTLVGSTVTATLNFKAGIDPNEANSGFPFNPLIVGHHIYYSTNEDPTTGTYVLVTQDSETDPNISKEITGLEDGTKYYWQVIEDIDVDETGTPGAADDPNNLVGPVWSFITVAATPSILVGPKNAVADASGNASFTVTGSATAQYYEWYRVGEATALTDTGIYSGTSTNTLTITGATLADEGRFYSIAYNGITPSTPSANAGLWMRRLAGYWKLDGDMADSVADEVSGAPAHDGAIAVSTAGGPGDPNYVDDANSLTGGAMMFFGDGDYLSIPDSDFFNYFNKGFTYSMWYKEVGNTGWALPMAKLNGGTAGWLFGKDSNVNEAVFIIENPNTQVNNGTTGIDAGDGNWHMLTATYDASANVIRMFIDGDEHASRTVNLANAPLPTAYLTIGGWASAVSISGAIDEVRAYTYPLTPAEVAQMYTGFRTDEFVCVIPDDSEFANFDLNNDCRINLSDFALMATQWLECQRVKTDSCDW